MADRVLRIGVFTPHVAVVPEVEFPAMARGRITTRLAPPCWDRSAFRFIGRR